MTRRKAFFGPPLGKFVDGGAHLAMEVITKKESRVLMVNRKNGLFGRDYGKWFFPHGEMLFGEPPEDCAARLTKHVLGMDIKNFGLVGAWSWVSEEQVHWHLVLISIASVTGNLKLETGVREGKLFSLARLPSNTAYWSKKDLTEIILRRI